MIRRILVPLDGSELSEAVLPPVEDLARRLPAEVHFVQAVSLATDLKMLELTGEVALDPNVVAGQLAAEAKDAEEYLTRLATQWQDRGIRAHWEVPRGSSAATIVEVARAQGVDLIAMSTHGRSGISRLVFGSVTDQVLRESGIPVLVVKPSQSTGEKVRRREG